jgi:uncharacterized C2H2 Zn-finger protein
MPKIEVYKGNGNFIPVVIAQKTKAFQCPFTQKIFSSKKNYVEHLRKRRLETIHKIRIEKSKKLLMDSLFKLDSFTDIINWIESHPTFFYYNSHKSYLLKNDISNIFSIQILSLDIEWKNNISNSHNCPHNGVKNWRRDEKFADGTPKPKYYSGWRGRISFRLSHDIGITSNLFNGTRINLACGGGNSTVNITYDVIFFDDDWPNLTKLVDRIRAESIITNSTHEPIKFYYKRK